MARFQSCSHTRPHESLVTSFTSHPRRNITDFGELQQMGRVHSNFWIVTTCSLKKRKTKVNMQNVMFLLLDERSVSITSLSVLFFMFKCFIVLKRVKGVQMGNFLMLHIDLLVVFN